MAAGQYRLAAIIGAVFVWSISGGVSLVPPAFAQTIISVTSNANGNFVEKDANGNTYA